MSKKKTKEPVRPNKLNLGLGDNFRGVSVSSYKTLEGWGYRFKCRIYKDGVEYRKGSFTDPIEAAVAYNKEARRLYTEKKAKSLGMWNYV